jgi:hypothetical protein
MSADDLPVAIVRPRDIGARTKAFEDWWNERGHSLEIFSQKGLAEAAFCSGIVDQEAWVICGPSTAIQPPSRLRKWTRWTPLFAVVMMVVANFFSHRTIIEYRQIVTNQNESLEKANQTMLAQNDALQDVDAALKACHCAPLPNHKSGSSSIIHVPPNGKCPDGDTRLKAVFIEPDGSKLDACKNPNGDGSVDVLMPGEGVEMHYDLDLGKQPADKNRKS